MAWKLHAIEQTQLRRKYRVDRVGRPKFDSTQVLKREDRMPLEPAWRERGCDYFFETTYLLTRKDAPVCDGAGRLMSLS